MYTRDEKQCIVCFSDRFQLDVLCELYVLVYDYALFAYRGRYAIHPNIFFVLQHGAYHGAEKTISSHEKDHFIIRNRPFR